MEQTTNCKRRIPPDDLDLMLSIASDISADQNTLHKFAHNKNLRVRLAVANNPKANQTILAGLSQDEIGIIRKAVAKNVSTDQDTLNTLGHSRDWAIRLAVAQNPSTQDKILEYLAEDKSYAIIRFFVAHHKNTSLKTLTQLQEDSDPEIAKIAVLRLSVIRASANVTERRTISNRRRL